MLYGCQFEEPRSVDVLSSAEDGRLVCAELGTRDKCRDILTPLQGKIDSYWRTIFRILAGYGSLKNRNPRGP